MRTLYPCPTFANHYDFKLVDSTFIHAVHLAYRKGNDGAMFGVSFQSDEDSINWYDVKNPEAVYVKMTNPKLSPGFTFNNSVKGKKFSTIKVNDNPVRRTFNVDAGNVSPKVAQGVMEMMKARLNQNGAATPPITSDPFIQCDKPNGPGRMYPKPVKVEYESSFGPLLDTCSNYQNSSCMSYIAMGYNKFTKGLVIYYALKSKMTDVYAVEVMDATIYTNWLKADSLGRYYNQVIKKLNPVLLRKRDLQAHP